MLCSFSVFGLAFARNFLYPVRRYPPQLRYNTLLTLLLPSVYGTLQNISHFYFPVQDFLSKCQEGGVRRKLSFLWI